MYGVGGGGGGFPPDWGVPPGHGFGMGGSVPSSTPTDTSGVPSGSPGAGGGSSMGSGPGIGGGVWGGSFGSGPVSGGWGSFGAGAHPAPGSSPGSIVTSGEGDRTTYGATKYKAETISSITCYAQLTLNGTTVTGHTMAYGTVDANKAKLNTLEANGVVNTKQTVVSGASVIKGVLIASGSIFGSSLTVHSNCVQLDNTTTKSITVKPSSTDKPMEIIVKNHSKIQGDVIFENTGGIVWLEPGSNITGRVMNGSVRMLETSPQTPPTRSEGKEPPSGSSSSSSSMSSSSSSSL